MSAKTAQLKKKKGSAKRGRFGFELTGKEVCLWLGVAFLIMVWMFTLGVVVGRGLSPVRFDVEKVAEELRALKEQALRRERQDRDVGTASPKDELDFYHALTDMKEEARLRSLPKAEERPSKPRAEQQTSHGARSRMVRKALEKPGPSPTNEGQRGGAFTLQVASLKDSAAAEEMVASLKSKGYSAYRVTAEVPGKGTYHRVRVGHFRDRSAARQAVAGLRQEDLEPLVIRE